MNHPARFPCFGRRASKPLTVAAAVAAVLGSLPAYSQAQSDEGGQGGEGLQEVVVTARYKQENLQTTPLAITALSVESLEERSLTNVDDVGLAIPNAFMRPPVSN